MTSRDDLYLLILRFGLLRLREAAAAGKSEYCSVEADHLHNIKTHGPDFRTTHFWFPEQKSQFGIYEGGHPQRFSADAKEVTTTKGKIGGQDVTWSLWKEKRDGKEVEKAEVSLVSEVIHFPEINEKYEMKFHIFLSAPSREALTAMQSVVQTLRKNESEQSSPPNSRPFGTSGTSPAEQALVPEASGSR